jgi:hypothetical protein
LKENNELQLIRMAWHKIVKSTHKFSWNKQTKKDLKSGEGNWIFCLDVEIGKREILS